MAFQDFLTDALGIGSNVVGYFDNRKFTDALEQLRDSDVIDPFGADQREFYQGRARDMMDPGYNIANTPGMQAALDQSEQTISRRAAAQGQTYSGNVMHDLTRGVSDLMLGQYNTQQQRALQAGGAQFAPAAGAYTQAATSAAEAQRAEAAPLGEAGAGLIDILFGAGEGGGLFGGEGGGGLLGGIGGLFGGGLGDIFGSEGDDQLFGGSGGGLGDIFSGGFGGTLGKILGYGGAAANTGYQFSQGNTAGGLGSAAGGILGGAFGGPVGAALGSFAGEFLGNTISPNEPASIGKTGLAAYGDAIQGGSMNRNEARNSLASSLKRLGGGSLEAGIQKAIERSQGGGQDVDPAALRAVATNTVGGFKGAPQNVYDLMEERGLSYTAAYNLSNSGVRSARNQGLANQQQQPQAQVQQQQQPQQQAPMQDILHTPPPQQQQQQQQPQAAPMGAVGSGRGPLVPAWMRGR